MRKALVIVLQCSWIFSVVTLGATIGAFYGWQHHSVMGTVALGFVGFCIGASVANAPLRVLQILM